MRMSPIRSHNAPPLQVASAAADTLLLPADSSRLGASFFNDSSSVLYLKYGAGASATSFSVKIAAGGYFEVPVQFVEAIYGFWASANGFAYCTSFR